MGIEMTKNDWNVHFCSLSYCKEVGFFLCRGQFLLSKTLKNEEKIKSGPGGTWTPDQSISYYTRILRTEILQLVSEYFRNRPYNKINDFILSEAFTALPELKFKLNSESNSESKQTDFYELLKSIDWFESSIIKHLIDSQDPKLLRRALILSTLKKPFYTKDDIEPLKRLGVSFDIYDDIFPVTITEQSTFGKRKKKWKCMNYVTTYNEMQYKYCSNCESFIYGIRDDFYHPRTRKQYFLDLANVLEEKLDSDLNNAWID